MCPSWVHINQIIIGINLSRLIIKSRDQKFNITNEIKKVVYEINKKYKMHVVFVPHVWDNYNHGLNDDYQFLKKIFKECLYDNLIVSLEAGTVSCWYKYLKHNDIAIGIDEFGKSAPYKEIYNEMNLTANKIVTIIQEKLRN